MTRLGSARGMGRADAGLQDSLKDDDRHHDLQEEDHRADKQPMFVRKATPGSRVGW